MIKPIFYLRIENIKISTRTKNALYSAGIIYVGELIQKTEKELLSLKHFGRKMLNEIKELLKDCGLSLDTKISNFNPDNKLELADNKMFVARKIQKRCHQIVDEINWLSKRFSMYQDNLDCLLMEMKTDLSDGPKQYEPFWLRFDLNELNNLEERKND